ncbi:hypothetical protein J4208_05485 [Candidatus Woesearchaeota archaeon]|nr:hypothetical protein [Candidatus Woesearchaeota archaeon]
MKYDWVKRIQEEKKGSIVQVRMMSTGNDLACNYPPQYGLFFVEKGATDPIELFKRAESAAAFSSLGGGFIREADIEFIVRKAPVFGYLIKRLEREENLAIPPRRETVGYTLTERRADRVAWQKALKTGTKIAKAINGVLEDRTSEDLKDFLEYAKTLRLEERVYRFKSRTAS